jgi:hypothetical protein
MRAGLSSLKPYIHLREQFDQLIYHLGGGAIGSAQECPLEERRVLAEPRSRSAPTLARLQSPHRRTHVGEKLLGGYHLPKVQHSMRGALSEVDDKSGTTVLLPLDIEHIDAVLGHASKVCGIRAAG